MMDNENEPECKYCGDTYTTALFEFRGSLVCKDCLDDPCDGCGGVGQCRCDSDYEEYKERKLFGDDF